MAHRKSTGEEDDERASSPSEQPANDIANQEQLLAIYKLVDHNKDGYIDSSDLGRLLQRLNMSATEAELAAMIRAQRTPKSTSPEGHLDFAGFCQMMERNRVRFSFHLDTDTLDMFRAIDRNQDGKISLNELCETMRATMDSGVLTDEDIKEMFESADTNRDGFISYEEFAQMTRDLHEEQRQQQISQEPKNDLA